MNSDHPVHNEPSGLTQQRPVVSPSAEASTKTVHGSTVDFLSAAPSSTRSDSPVAGTLLGDYELLDKLGSGGMGVVYRARQRSADRIVAIKVIRPERLADLSDEKRQEWLDRFRAEAQATARLQHENIVTVYEVGQLDDVPFYSMRYIDGRSLADIIRNGPLENCRAAAMLEPVARAVHHAHTAGILHRDLKPRNILIDSGECPLVMDFGLAKWLEQETRGVTQTGQIMGTPEYMSPEQACDSSQVTAASDLYSLGATLYDLVTGRPPFQAASSVETLRQVMDEEPVAPRQLNQAIDRDLETITLKCLAKEPVRRYGSASDLADDLRRYLNGEPIHARPVFLPERAWRWSRRHPAAAGAIAAVLIGLVSVSVLSAALWSINQRLVISVAAETDAKNDSELKRVEAVHAREAETEAKNSAVAKEKETKQAFDFLVGALRKPDPDADGEKITVAELLGQAVEQLETTFPNQPLIQAQLLRAIGMTYRGMGLFQKSVVVCERARDMYRNELGEGHEDTLGAMHNLASAYHSVGRLSEALPLYEETLGLRKSKLGPEHSDTLSSMNSLASAYESTGRLSEALPLHQRTLELMKANLGLEHPATLASMNNLAYAYQTAGRLADALPLYEQALELKKAKLGPEHPETLKAMHNLASVYQYAGMPSEALPIYEKTLELMKAKYGPQHPSMLVTMNNLAAIYQSTGRLAEALPLLEQTLEMTKAKLGAEHPNTLGPMNNLAATYQAAGRLAEALPIYEQTLERMKAIFGPEHPDTLVSMNNLAFAYHSAGRRAEALPLWEQTLKLRESKLGPEHTNTLTTMGNLANAYLLNEQPEKALPLFERFIAGQRGRAKPDDPALAGLLAAVSLDLLKHRQYPAAETYLRECLTIREKKLPDDWVLFNTRSMLGGALAGQKKFQEAEPLLVEGYSGMKDREAKIPPAAKPRLAEAVRRLVDLYTAWDKAEEAAKWRGVLEESASKPE